jgi:hypothetical protein
MFEIIVESDYDGFTGVIGQKNSFPMIGYNGFEIRPGKSFQCTKIHPYYCYI